MENRKLGGRHRSVLRWMPVLVLCGALWAPLATLAQSSDISFQALPVLQAATPVPGNAHVPGDFNGDATSDLLWFNPSESTLGYWTMRAGRPDVLEPGVVRTGARTYRVTPGYFVAASGDFDDDGFADLVFTSAAHDLWLWTNNHRGGFTSHRIGDYPNGWRPVGAGDINGDGHDDLLWLDKDTCQFGYWLMQGARRTGMRTMAITCGYHPMGIGYYNTSNRLSILWTSAAGDLYIWDSTGPGFKTYDLSSYIDLTGVWAFGGGYMGTYMGLERVFLDGDGKPYAGEGLVYSRVFDARGNQLYLTAVPGSGWTGGSSANPASGGYIIKAGQTRFTGLYVIDRDSRRIGAAGVSAVPITGGTGNAPVPDDLGQWAYPDGWYVVGAPANTTTASP